jgi:hypothetical protein
MNSNKIQMTAEMNDRMFRLFVDHDMTDNESLAHILVVEQKMTLADAAKEMSRYTGKIVIPESVNTWKQRAGIKISKNVVFPAGINRHGQELRWAVIITRDDGDIFTSVCNSQEDAIMRANYQWGHLTKTEQKKTEIVVGTVAITPGGLAFTEEDADIHECCEWKEEDVNDDNDL